MAKTYYFHSSVIESAEVNEVRDDGKTQEMILWFVNGRTYSYLVAKKTIEEFLKADSIGQAYNRLIKGKFPCERLD